MVILLFYRWVTPYLLVVLGAGWWHIVDVLGGGKMSGDIIFILLRLPCVVYINLTNPCGHHHLGQRERGKRVKDAVSV